MKDDFLPKVSVQIRIGEDEYVMKYDRGLSWMFELMEHSAVLLIPIFEESAMQRVHTITFNEDVNKPGRLFGVRMSLALGRDE